MTMKDGICPNCQSNKVYHKLDDNLYNRIPVGGRRDGGFRPHVFICTNCGYMMEFIHRNHFEAIEKKWTNVQEANRQKKEQLKPKRKRKNDEL